MIRWMRALRLNSGKVDRPVLKAPASSKPAAVPPAYLSLYKYLNERYAQTVVLTFAEIEDLIGFALPDPASLQREWWGNAPVDRSTTGHTRSWTEANRTATPNLLARTVLFARAPA
jgi:hypothetical protein